MSTGVEHEIEVCGEAVAAPQFGCLSGDLNLRYAVDAALKRGGPFRLGAFFSKSVLSNGLAYEVNLVEQSNAPYFRERLHADVRNLHQPMASTGFNKSSARLRTWSICEGGWLPVVHAWHAPALGKLADPNREHHQQLMAQPATERIRALTVGAPETTS